MGPLFPRLHVKDTDKGGARAPPRNKMALYEQLSIPSQRFGSAAASTLPLPLHNASNLVPPASLSQGCGHERSVFTPFYTPSHRSAHSTEKVHSHSSGEMDLNAWRVEIERKYAKQATQRTVNASTHLTSAAESSSFRPHDLSSMKDSCVKKSEDEEDFRIPTFIDSRITPYSDKDPHVIDTERPTPFKANTSHKNAVATPISHDKSLERPSTTVTLKEHTEKSILHLETGERAAEPSDFAKKFSNQKHISGTVDDLENSEHGNTRVCKDLCGPQFLTNIEITDKGDASGVRNGSCSKMSLGSPNVAENFNGERKDKVPKSLELGDANNEVSETSIVDSMSGLDISPDDVIGAIGTKHFWKTRRAIVNQQRVFAVQLFELHRLIKVQKLIAASPDLLLEGNPYLSKFPPQDPSMTLASECIGKSSPQIVKQKDDSQRPNNNNVCPTKDTVGVPPLPSCEDGLSKGSAGQFPRSGPYSGDPTPVSVVSDHKPGAWCFHPPANQWLIPVMSPSEGLIYKPYTGPCPSPAVFMAPVYGGCGPLSLPPVTGDFMNPAYGVPASHQQQNIGVHRGAPAVAPNYFPAPYGLPVVNPIISSSAVEQVSPLAGQRPNGQAEQHSRSSCNMSNLMSEALTSCVRKFQKSKDSEWQGSTASSPCEKVQGEGRDALSLFPMASATEGSGRPIQAHGGDQTRVIKVVPHNRRSAIVSAARIFRSIQIERQQYESM